MIPNPPEEFARIVSEERALAILKTLHRQTGYSTNEFVMGRWLEALALGGTQELIRSELGRLEALLVIKTEHRGQQDEVMVFWLTERGIDYLECRTPVEGLPRIGPDSRY